MNAWPATPDQLIKLQEELGNRETIPWFPGDDPVSVGGCFVCFGGDPSATGARGDPGWAGAALWRNARIIATSLVKGVAGAPYEPGLLALREGPLLEAAVQALTLTPDVLLVNATGRDHPRRCGMAIHLGAVLEVPTIGVTHRPLMAHGVWPGPHRGDSAGVRLAEEEVGSWLRTQPELRPLVVHAGWRTDLVTAEKVVLAVTPRYRTPEPLRQARRLTRTARAQGTRQA